MPVLKEDGAGRAGVRRIGLASGVGSTLEFYDFAIYGTAAALVFSQIFFISEDEWFGAFLGLATFAVGFLFTPLGALLFGWLGDRYGRRFSLLLTFVVMGASTLLMGVLPSYLAIGITAPLLLIVLRVFHGLARGGEIGGAAVLAVEHAPTHRRALYGSFAALGSPIGQLLANLAFALVLLLPMQAVIDWAWRLPFLVGGVVLVLGVWARRGVDETPAFVALPPGRRPPFLAVFRQDWKRLLLAAGVNMGLNANMFILATFMLSYATAAAPQGLALPRQPIVLGSVIGLLCHAVTIVVACRLSDRIGRKPVMTSAAVASMAYAMVMFRISDIGTPLAVGFSVVIGFTIGGFLFGPLLTYFSELFSVEQRQAGVGLAFQLGSVLGGGLAPMIANRLIAVTGSSDSVGWYLAAGLLVTVLCLLALPETAPARTGGVS
ncbi:MFS transporter [Saccharopolyspora rhizosphaerae]|uniref:MFS transporter n=1 Tax=Saccharopolyspora rhizosphaerae TaxID=2492662 RepID=A0A3R8QP72_9PSEU|nr:MFS transporter [Saccharopolyspora rhizosphaerae]RRO16742.1 MFS transporter [Saccharopolyspora rhizosphaerae]